MKSIRLTAKNNRKKEKQILEDFCSQGHGFYYSMNIYD